MNLKSRVLSMKWRNYIVRATLGSFVVWQRIVVEHPWGAWHSQLHPSTAEDLERIEGQAEGSGIYIYIYILYSIYVYPFRLQHLGKNPFGELFPGKMNIVILEVRSKQALFWKWLPRPNHYAHETRIEILSRTPVSILRDLSPWPQNHK